MNTKSVRELAAAVTALCDELDRDEQARAPSSATLVVGPASPQEYRDAVKEFMAACDAAGEVLHVEAAPQDAAHYWRRAAEKWHQVANALVPHDQVDLDAARASQRSACVVLGEPTPFFNPFNDACSCWRTAAQMWRRAEGHASANGRLALRAFLKED